MNPSRPKRILGPWLVDALNVGQPRFLEGGIADVLGQPRKSPKMLRSSHYACVSANDQQTLALPNRASPWLCDAVRLDDSIAACRAFQTVLRSQEDLSMDDLGVFIRGYTRDSLSRVTYAGAIDPQNSEASECWKLPRERRDDFLRNDDPNFSFRSAVLSYLFRSDPNPKSTGPEASDELIHDLFIAHWEFAVGHDNPGDEQLAEEVLRRDLFGTFVHAYRLPLGMDQGIPLEIAIQRRTGLSGASPVSHLLNAIDQLLQHEAGTNARRNLNEWQRQISKKYPQKQP